MNSDLNDLLEALSHEHRYAKQEHQRQSQLPFDERIALGFALPPLPIKKIDDRDIEFRIPTRISIHDGIEAGDLVSIFPPSAEGLAQEATCSYVDPYSIEVYTQRPIPPSWEQKETLCIQRRFDERSFLLQEKGIHKAILHESPLKEALLGSWAISIPQQTSNRPLLNMAQSIAVETAKQSEHLSIIHGPPGTGKTHTIAQMCTELLTQEHKIWVLADSNAAVDHLCSTIAALGIDILRLGSRYRISSSTWHLSLYHRLEKHPFATALKKLEKEIRTAHGSEKGMLVRQKRELMKRMRQDILHESPIIASTLGTMHREAAHLPTPYIAIVDEASQVIDSSIWSIVPYIPKLLLVGDPHQLGPVVFSQNKRLSSTLLQRKMIEQVCPMLNVQHRMHNNIHQLVQATYGEDYIPHSSVANRRLCDEDGIIDDELTSKQLIWIDTTGAEEGEQRDSITRSLYNNTEIEWVVRTYQALKSRNIHSIGIIAPYSAQVQRIRAQLPDAIVNTVTAFQGQEKDVMICSFVRANFDGELGFVADAERLTVSLTRAKKLLVAIGDSSLLSINPVFSSLFEQIDQQDAWMSIWDEAIF